MQCSAAFAGRVVRLRPMWVSAAVRTKRPYVACGDRRDDDDPTFRPDTTM